jgi:Ca-activated chloride channel family protein
MPHTTTRSATRAALIPDPDFALLHGIHGNPMPLQGVSARGRLEGLVFELTVEQRYRNDTNRNVETVFTFPLPLRAVFLGLELEIGDRRLSAHAVARQEANERYERAIDAGDSAALLEHDGNGLYTVSLGNLQTGETAVIRYRYAEIMDAHHRYLRLNVPTVIAPRYGDPRDGGLEGPAVPGTDLLAEYPFEIRVELAGLDHAAAVRSPSHRIAVSAAEAGLEVTLARKGFLDRDFVLEIDQAAIPRRALVARDGDGYVCLASPVLATSTSEHRPLALKILVDCSGSMAGDSIAAARRALLSILDRLSADDHVSLARFGRGVEHVTEGFEIACEHKLRPLKALVRRLDADLGGTEMGAALKSILPIEVPPARQPDIILITDGEIHDVEGVLNLVAYSRHRLFAIAIGAAPVEGLARGLAERTGGSLEFVGPGEDAEAAILRTFMRLRAAPRQLGPVQWPVRPQWTVTPRSTVFPGDTLQLFAGFATAPAGMLEVTVNGPAGDDAVIQVPVEPRMIQGDLLPRLAAARRLERMDDEAARVLAIRYQLATPYTSFVVVAERADGEKAEDLPATIAVPHMLAAGWGGSASAVLRGPETMTVHKKVWGPASMDVLDIPAFNRPEPALCMPKDQHFPVALIETLNTVKPRSLRELGALGVPEKVLSDLRTLMEREGFQEEAVVEAFLALLMDRFDDHEMAGNIRAFLAGRQFRVLRRSMRGVVDRALAAPWP